MKSESKNYVKIGISLFVLYLAVTYWSSFSNFCLLIVSAAMPLIIGFVIAYIINVLMSFYEKHYFIKNNHSKHIKSKRFVCMIGSFFTLLIILFCVLKLVVPEFISCLKLVFTELPEVVEEVLMILKEYEIISDDFIEMINIDEVKANSQQILKLITSGAGNIAGTVTNVVSELFSGAVTLLLGLIFSIYLLAGKERLLSQVDRLMCRYIKKDAYIKIKHVSEVLNESFRKYIVGQCTEAVIIGSLCTVGMLILNLPYATMIGALIGFTALIPVAGAYIGAGVGAIMILTVSPMKAIIFLIYIVVLQQLEGNLIYPRVVGTSLGLPAIWVLASVTIGGGVLGIAGMLISVPITSTIYRLLQEDVNRLSKG